jgi:hypothetical protein
LPGKELKGEMRDTLAELRGAAQPSARGQEIVERLEEQLRPEERRWFPRVLRALHQEGVPFMLAGAFALYYHTGFWRGTKDLDVLVLPEHREQAIEAVEGAGLRDMFAEEPYDREWIFRSRRDGVIVDLIWRMANYSDDVSPEWIARSTPAEFLGVPVRVVNPADLCWMKLFVFQRLRCDWPDIINIIRGTQGDLDWNLLLREVGPHWRLLCALVDIYDWLCPPERAFIPPTFRAELEARRRSHADADPECRKDLFDTRPWLTGPGAGSHG